MSTLPRFLYHLLISLLFLSSLIAVSIGTQINPYKVLNVPKHATQKEIRKAFKTLALKYHPDRNLASSDPDKMKKITAAYEILGDPDRRKKHDEQERQNNIFSAHGFRTRSGSSSSDGIGVSLTTYNYYNLLYNIHDVPWLILAYEDFSQSCKQAKAIYEDACIKLQGIARCGKVDVNKQSALINEFGLRRVPHFVIFYNLNGKQYQKSISWRGREKIKIHSLIDGVADIFPKKCKIIKTENDMKTFINDIEFNDKYYNKVKAVIFSDAKNRYSPHILLEYLATKFEDEIDFGYIHINMDRPKLVKRAYLMATEIGLGADDLEPPSMYILRSPLIQKELLKIENDDILQTLEDIGIYHISLSSDVDSMKTFVEQYSLPLIPKIDADNYLEQCFFSNSLENVDEDKICYLFTINNENKDNLQRLFVFGQYILAALDESVQFGWINCEQQKEFCESMTIIPTQENNIKLIAIKAYQDYYQLYDNGDDIILNPDYNENKGLIEYIVDWIGLLEKDDVVFGDNGICDDNNTEKCKNKRSGDNNNNNNDKWKNGVLFPIKTPNWSDNIDDVLGGLTSVFGFVGTGVGAGFSAISTLLSSVFQIFFVIIIFVFLLPMLRMAR